MRKRFRRKQGNGVFRNRIYSQSLRKTELQFVRWIEPRGAEPATLHPFRTVVTTRLCPRGRRTNTGMGFPDIREKSFVVSIIYICRFSGGSSRMILCRAEKGTAGSFTDFQYPLFRVGRSVCGHLAAEFCVSDVGLCPFSGKRRRQDEAPFADRSVPFFSTDSFGSV